MASLAQLLRISSRTFGVGIAALPPRLRKEVTVAYLLLRVSDYLEDSRELADVEKIRLLSEWRRVLAGQAEPHGLVERLKQARDDIPDAVVARHADTVLEGLDRLDPSPREIIVRRVRETTAGMVRWTRRGSVFHTEGDLDDYMHEVAGRVGHLLTELFVFALPGIEDRRERMMRRGREYGLALQTVNVIRGLHEDPKRGWVYLPSSFLPNDGIDAAELFEPAHRDIAMAVLSRLVDKAGRHLEAARPYIACIPRRHYGVRVFCMLPLFFAIRTLALSRANPAVLERETKMTRSEVVAVTRNARVLSFSNRWIDWYCRRLAAV